jgi:TolB protein
MAEALETTRSLAIGVFTGSTGATASQSLTTHFGKLDEVTLVEEKTARYILSGTSVSGRINARLADRTGNLLFERTYGAPELDENIEALADDVVMAITGLPGAAGTRIAFVSNVTGTKQVHVCKSDGSGMHRVTSSAHGAVSPALSPDGSLLGYTSYQKGFPEVMLVDLGGGMERQLASTPGANSGLAFAPQDRRAAMTMSFLGNPEIFVVDLGTHNAICLTESTGAPSSPTWHPEGQLLMYASDEDGSGSQLYVVDVGSESSAQQWSSGYRFATDPEWSPDGKTLAYTARLAGDWAVVIKPYEGGRAQVLRSGGAQHPTWSPDGKSLAYVQNGQLWVHEVATDRRRSIVRGMGEISEPRWMR